MFQSQKNKSAEEEILALLETKSQKKKKVRKYPPGTDWSRNGDHNRRLSYFAGRGLFRKKHKSPLRLEERLRSATLNDAIEREKIILESRANFLGVCHPCGSSKESWTTSQYCYKIDDAQKDLLQSGDFLFYTDLDGATQAVVRFTEIDTVCSIKTRICEKHQLNAAEVRLYNSSGNKLNFLILVWKNRIYLAYCSFKYPMYPF
jgi:hypothetical protein